MIKYECAHCQALLETPDEMGGKTEPCPECGHVNSVPLSKVQQQEQKRRENEAEAKRQALEREGERHRLELVRRRDALRDALKSQEASSLPVSEQVSQSKAENQSKEFELANDAIGAPKYEAVYLLGKLQVVLGVICIIAAVLVLLVGVSSLSTAGSKSSIDKQEAEANAWLHIVYAVAVFLAGVMYIGLGQVFQCLRDMARNSFQLHKPNR